MNSVVRCFLKTRQWLTSSNLDLKRLKTLQTDKLSIFWPENCWWSFQFRRIIFQLFSAAYILKQWIHGGNCRKIIKKLPLEMSEKRQHRQLWCFKKKSVLYFVWNLPSIESLYFMMIQIIFIIFEMNLMKMHLVRVSWWQHNRQ